MSRSCGGGGGLKTPFRYKTDQSQKVTENALTDREEQGFISCSIVEIAFKTCFINKFQIPFDIY